MVEHIGQRLHARNHSALLTYLYLDHVGIESHAVLPEHEVEIAGGAALALPHAGHIAVARGFEEVESYRLAVFNREIVVRAILVAVEHDELAARLGDLGEVLVPLLRRHADVEERELLGNSFARAARFGYAVVFEPLRAQLLRALAAYLFQPFEILCAHLLSIFGEGAVVYLLGRLDVGLDVTLEPFEHCALARKGVHYILIRTICRKPV